MEWKGKVRFECTICMSSYGSSQALKVHHKSKHLETDSKFSCQDCGKQYTTENGLVAHVKRVHKGIKYKCNQCDKEFTTSSNRSLHIRSYHEHVKYECSMCDHQATSKGNLISHKKSVHDSVKYLCNICDDKLTSKHGLRYHIELKHKGIVKQYNCNDCNKKFKAESTFNKTNLTRQLINSLSTVFKDACGQDSSKMQKIEEKKLLVSFTCFNKE